MATLSVQDVDDLLPQTQCTRCGYPGCLPYAQAIVEEGAPINRCPPGGEATIRALSTLMGVPVLSLDPTCGAEGPLAVACIDEARCIGCTLCIQACPVDAILGAVRRMHDVLPALCTGCELCLAPCPMDCIVMVAAEPPRPWTREDTLAARARMHARTARLEREAREEGLRVPGQAGRRSEALDELPEVEFADVARRTSLVEQAMERARRKLGLLR